MTKKKKAVPKKTRAKRLLAKARATRAKSGERIDLRDRFPEPSAELDAEVARILGWQDVRVLAGGRMASGKPPFDTVEHMVPCYSQIDGFSVDLLKHLRSTGRFCCIDLKSDYDYVWDFGVKLDTWREYRYTRRDVHEYNVFFTESTENLAYGTCILLVSAFEAIRLQDERLERLKAAESKRKGNS